MKTICKCVVIVMALVFMLITDVPLLFVQLVPDAHAILGVRRRTARRTAVVVGSAASAEVAASQQQTAAAQQEAAAAQQEAAAAKQEAAAAQQQAAQSASAVPIGAVVQSLPVGCTSVVVNNASYSNCAGVYYKAAFQGNSLVYVVVPKP
ncbi:MAG: hypothetical protein HGJ93_17795 [Desulfosarcina sp.]|nr:hypothetical protein [Desulfosarcina sp.]MBC2767735.1 hypothetical protein [Desulfosarcina sp.]